VNKYRIRLLITLLIYRYICGRNYITKILIPELTLCTEYYYPIKENTWFRPITCMGKGRFGISNFNRIAI
jgi:hypothetical protein